MSGWARIGLFLLVQTVMKTITTPLAGSRAGKCTGVLRCIRSFIIIGGTRSVASALFVVSGSSLSFHCVRFVTSRFCFGHDEAWPSDLPQTCDVAILR